MSKYDGAHESCPVCRDAAIHQYHCDFEGTQFLSVLPAQYNL